MTIRQSSKNNFDIIRLSATLMVIVSHSFGFFSNQDPLAKLTMGKLGLGALAVNVFFLISGYLISKSWVNKPDLKIFFTNRVLRIFPGLILVVLFSAFIVGPIFTNLRPGIYFTNIDTYKYLLNICLVKLHFYLPGVFVSNGHPHIVNAPLWTLFFEFIMYVIIALWGVAGALNKKNKQFYLFILTYAFFIVTSFMDINPNEFILKINTKNFSEFYLYFFTGTLINIFQDKIRLKLWHFIPLLAICFLLFNTPAFTLSALLLTCYFTFYLAFVPISFDKITKYGDFSYGIYLYGYVIQNIISELFINELNIPLFIFASILFTIPFAVLSWVFIESKALQLKKSNYLPVSNK